MAPPPTAPPRARPEGPVPVWAVVLGILVFGVLPFGYMGLTQVQWEFTPNTRPTITLTDVHWEGATAVATVGAISTSVLNSSQFTYQVVASDGTVYCNRAAWTATTTGGVHLIVEYRGSGGGDQVNRGDLILVYVSPAEGTSAIHGTTLKVLQGVDVLGTALVP